MNLMGFLKKITFEWGSTALKILLIILIFQIIKYVTKRIMRSVIKSRLKNSPESRIMTLCSISDDFLKYTVNGLMIIASIYQLGISTPLILGSIGVFSVIIGLAAQSLLNDFINGIFTVIEGYYDVGDFVKIGNFEGTVTSLGIKSTVLIDSNCRIVTIPNSKIDEIVNYTKTDNSIYVNYYFDSSTDVNLLFETLNCVTSIKSDTTYKFLGISEIKFDYIIVSFEIKCSASERFQAQRDLNKEIIMIIKNHEIKLMNSKLNLVEDYV